MERGENIAAKYLKRLRSILGVRNTNKPKSTLNLQTKNNHSQDVVSDSDKIATPIPISTPSTCDELTAMNIVKTAIEFGMASNILREIGTNFIFTAKANKLMCVPVPCTSLSKLHLTAGGSILKSQRKLSRNYKLAQAIHPNALNLNVCKNCSVRRLKKSRFGRYKNKRNLKMKISHGNRKQAYESDDTVPFSDESNQQFSDSVDSFSFLDRFSKVLRK